MDKDLQTAQIRQPEFESRQKLADDYLIFNKHLYNIFNKFTKTTEIRRIVIIVFFAKK